MSITYKGISWNPQKRKYDWILAACCITYLTLFIGIKQADEPGESLDEAAIGATATLALILIHTILCIGPLTRISKKFLPLLYNRRHLGVTAFLVAATHATLVLVRIYSQKHVNPFLPLFTWGTAGHVMIANFPFRPLGLFALIILLFLASTSHDFWMNTLGPKVWKSLHMLVYLAYLLIVLHVVLGVMQHKIEPVFLVILLMGSTLLVTLHVSAGLREVRKDSRKYLTQKRGFVRVCRVTDIDRNRAKTFCIDKERIAVFRVENKLFAVHNICSHQQGPLGEGKVSDGCIICPWHGYQYLPSSGKAPHPYKEKICTYDVKIEHGLVWINPKPFPAGTERPGAEIHQDDQWHSAWSGDAS